MTDNTYKHSICELVDRELRFTDVDDIMNFVNNSIDNIDKDSLRLSIYKAVLYICAHRTNIYSCNLLLLSDENSSRAFVWASTCDIIKVTKRILKPDEHTKLMTLLSVIC